MARRFKPTADQRKQVEVLRGGGMAEESIAQAVGVTRVTLRKYFADELESGGSRARSEMMARLFEAGQKGNVAAQKAYLSMGVPSSEAMAEPLGKKERAAREAETAHEQSEWGSVIH